MLLGLKSSLNVKFFDPFLAGLKFSEEGSVELVGDGRLLEELDPLPLSPYHVNGTQCGREEDRSAKDLVFAGFCSVSLTVLLPQATLMASFSFRFLPLLELLLKGAPRSASFLFSFSVCPIAGLVVLAA